MEILKRKRRFKIKWNKYKTIILLCFLLSLVGFLCIENRMPQFIKNRSKFSIYFSISPFDLRFKTENYTLYFNDKVLNNLQNRSYKVFNNAKDFSKNINPNKIKINTGFNIGNKLNLNDKLKGVENVFLQIKYKIEDAFFSGRVK
ncbi:hypothetical protein [Clostridium niameyense]|uniref:hypothetical protein n=1 Tax=Clostridium niameyense TaxID=1622073 RepID=UPI00067F31EF|nr:hypothetical protein [Clostridium niameyense]